MLGVGERTFRRWCRRFEEEGEATAGPPDWQGVGKRVPVDRCEEVERLYRMCYQASPRGISTSIWFGTTGSPGVTAGRRRSCKAGICCRRRSVAGRTVGSGLVVPCPASCCTRTLHARVAGRGAGARSGGDNGRCDKRDLFGVPGRGTRHGFNIPALLDVFGARFAAEPLYRSRKSLLLHSRSRRQGGSRPAHPGRRALRIWASSISRYSPQARGRSERLFQTLQDRVPKELALAASRRCPKPTPGCATLIYRRTTRASRSRGAGRQRLRRGARIGSGRGAVRPGRTHRRQRHAYLS